MPKLDRDKLNTAIDDEERERREESATRRLLHRAQDQVESLERKVDLLTAIDSVDCTPAEWSQPKSPQKGTHAIANLMLSDLHLDEVVDPAIMRGKNAYNRKIALQRLKRTGDNTIKMARTISGIQIDGLYLWANGDVVSGNIHDELRRTNDSQDVIDTVDYWVDPLAALCDQLADHFGKVHIVVSYGNHGRNYERPVSKGSVRSSFDWLTWRTIWRELKRDDRITWNIPESKDVRESHYGFRYLMLHGDDFKGGDQIAGAVRPVMFGDYRTLVAEVQEGEPYDMMLVGHFHTYTTLPRVVINGSLVGYSEYAKDHKYRPEPPKQAFWLSVPEIGPSFHLPILSCNRKAEGW